jgi:uncharacterized protein YcaQ
VTETAPAGPGPRRLTREEARRIAIRAQLLDADRPGELIGVVQRLTFLQLDPTAVVAPTADLVAWSRIGRDYEPAHLQQALERDRTLFEHFAGVAIVRPMADLGLFLAEMAAWPPDGSDRAGWLLANDAFRRRVLDQLRDSGPLSSRQIPDTSVVAWQSTGWTNNRNVTKLLELLAHRGEVAVAMRRGRERLWDLGERVYPAGIRTVPEAQARRIRDARRLRSLGIARAKVVGDAGLAVEIEGTKGPWRVDPDASAEAFRGRTALLSPFDRLTHDRTRALEVFDFDYILEMYKPKPQRRWGFFALPILHDDRLVGKLDARADRDSGALEVSAIHEDVPFTARIRGEVEAEIRTLADWLRLDRVRYA